MKLVKYILLLAAVGTFSSCKKFLDVNKNPNSPTTPPINGLLTRVTQNAALNVYRVANITSYYVQYLASPNTASPTDVYEPIDASSTWTSLYDNMTDAYDLEKMAAEQGATQYQGVAKILMAMDLHLVHNLWGAAPYSAAFKGDNLTPAYDEPQVLFQRVLTLLDEGIALLNQTGSTRNIPVASGSAVRTDLVHNGSNAAWIRTANALKARLLNQLSETNQYSTTAIFNALAAAYTAAGQDAFITTFAVRNPWNQLALNNQNLLLDAWVSDYLVISMRDTLHGIADPRLPKIASLTKYGDYRGTRNGRGRSGSGTTKDESYLDLNGYYSSSGSPLFIITYEEMKFIEAEAALRSNDKPRAYNAYLEGIRANMNKLGVAPAARDAYLNDPRVAVGSANLTLAHIFREKYKALVLMPVTWDDARRFDYMYQGFQLPVNAVTGTFIRRLLYPGVEVSRNGANVPVVNSVTQKLWWDQ
jgi:hypothetical protein